MFRNYIAVPPPILVSGGEVNKLSGIPKRNIGTGVAMANFIIDTLFDIM